MPYNRSHQHPLNTIISSQVVRSKKVDAHMASTVQSYWPLFAGGLTALQNADDLAAEGLTALQIP